MTEDPRPRFKSGDVGILAEAEKSPRWKYMRKTGYTLLKRMDEPFVVETNEGELAGKTGDYLAVDPKTGHVWPIDRKYVSLNYEVV